MKNRELDHVLNSIREDVAAADVEKAAGERVRARLESECGESAVVARLESCADFQALAPGYRSETLTEARRMLVEDHLHSCVACRRFFKGERAAVVAIRPQRQVWRVAPWAIAAAAGVALYFAATPVLDRVLRPSGARATVASIDGELYRVSANGSSLLTAGAEVGENDEVRTAKGSRAVLKLRDGSSVEMAERTDLAINERWRGKTVRLAQGAVMVEAAKQRNGRLEIATRDALVSVKGTIFEVSSGLKGSSVSVVEGEVKVDHQGDSALLHRGDQKTTSETIAPTSVAQAVAWSENSAKYLALLGELKSIEKKIEQIPAPGLRYQSNLAGLVPANTMIYASIPNLGSTLDEATRIFEDRVKNSDVLREWWNEKQTQQLRAIVDQARTVSSYLGDEIVVAVPAGGNAGPVLIAEAKKPGLDQILAPLAKAGGPAAMVRGGVVAVAQSARQLEEVRSLADGGRHSAFLSTPFWNRISRTYQSGAGWVFAINMEQITGGNVPSNTSMGFDNVNFLTIERKQNLGRTETSAALDFSGARHGLMSWLGAPGPMGTLDFVSPEATFASTLVIRNPATLLQELTTLGSLSAIEKNTGVNLSDVAQKIGGEVTVAFDGPLLPTPSWKVAIEVNDPAGIEQAIESGAAAASVKVASGELNGLAYHSITIPQMSYEIDYAFSDGYMLIAPSAALLGSAMATRSSGLTLTRSAAFRAQLPQDGHANFSALMYYNMGSTVGPIIDQLKKGGLMTAEQQKSIALLDQDREPGLVYAYGEPDRIVVASRGGFFGFGLDTLVGLNAKGAAALPQLLPPILSVHVSGH